MSWWSRLANVLRSDRLARDLEDEQRFHLEARANDLAAAGLSPEAARAEAARRFGGRLQLREASRDVKLLPWLESLGRAVLSGFFAALGLALAAIGLYGVSVYTVVRRTREIGIRLTLGARASAIVGSVLGQVARAVAVGVVAGLAGGIYFAGFVPTLLYEVEPVSVSSFALPVAGLLAVAVTASWIPARRALRVDPAVCLRME